MLRIRLSRTGKKNFPHYAIVVTEKTNPAIDGNFVEKLGSYSPVGDNPSFTCDHERVKYWVSVGAQPTETMARLLVKDGLSEMSKFYDADKKYNKKSKKGSSDEASSEAKGEGGEEIKEEKKEEGGEEAPAEASDAKEEAPAETPAEAPADVKEEEKAEEPKEEAPAEEEKEEAKEEGEEKSE